MPHAQWRLLLSPPASGPDNMALDEALMLRASETGQWVLRVYSWAAPTISLGRNQTARALYDLGRIRERGLSVVRRLTGGRAILHHREITYSVTGPTQAAGGLRESYERINRLLLSGLRSLGIEAVTAGATTRAIAPGVTPCFDEPAAGELTLDGRKLAGSAQWRSEGALLQHGSILVEDDQSSLAGLTMTPHAAIPRPATLAKALGRTPSPSEVAAVLGDAVRSLEDPEALPLTLDDSLRARASGLVVRYTDDAWTWRR
jgi:lipoate-protein ligase A